MLFDKNLILSGDITPDGLTGQALNITSNSAVNSTNVIDLMQNRDLAACDDLYLYIKLLTTFTPAASTATSLEIVLAAVDSATDSVSGDNFVIASTGDNYIATLNAKGEFVLKLSPQFDTLGRRYLMMKYARTHTPSTAETITGSIFAALTLGANIQKTYPAGYAII